MLVEGEPGVYYEDEYLGPDYKISDGRILFVRKDRGRDKIVLDFDGYRVRLGQFCGRSEVNFPTYGRLLSEYTYVPLGPWPFGGTRRVPVDRCFSFTVPTSSEPTVQHLGYFGLSKTDPPQEYSRRYAKLIKKIKGGPDGK